MPTSMEFNQCGKTTCMDGSVDRSKRAETLVQQLVTKDLSVTFSVLIENSFYGISKLSEHKLNDVVKL